MWSGNDSREQRVFQEDYAVTNRSKRFRKLKSIDYDKWVGVESSGDGVKQINERCCSGGGGLKSKLVVERHTGHGQSKRRIDIVSDHNTVKTGSKVTDTVIQTSHNALFASVLLF